MKSMCRILVDDQSDVTKWWEEDGFSSEHENTFISVEVAVVEALRATFTDGHELGRLLASLVHYASDNLDIGDPRDEKINKAMSDLVEASRRVSSARYAYEERRAEELKKTK